jgi:hypothetical protein
MGLIATRQRMKRVGLLTRFPQAGLSYFGKNGHGTSHYWLQYNFDFIMAGIWNFIYFYPNVFLPLIDIKIQFASRKV